VINYILFATLAFFWGGSFVAIKYLIHDVPAFSAAFYRVFFAIIFLLIIYVRKLKLPKGWFGKELFYSSIAGLCSIGVPFSLLFWGEKFVSPSMAGVLNGTVPFWTLILSILFFGGLKDITLTKVCGLVTGFIGIAFIFGPKITLSGNPMETYGLLAIVIMSIFYGMGTNLNKTILSKNTIVTGPLNTVVQQVVSVFYLAVVMLVFDGVPDLSLLAKPTNYLSVLYLSLFSTCLAFIIFYRLIHYFGAVKTSTVTFFVPPIALCLDGILFGRSLTLYEGVGASIIFLSMFMLRNKKQS
jgi:drug/metabolite transporter (DMT)-like permease